MIVAPKPISYDQITEESNCPEDPISSTEFILTKDFRYPVYPNCPPFASFASCMPAWKIYRKGDKVTGFVKCSGGTAKSPRRYHLTVPDGSIPFTHLAPVIFNDFPDLNRAENQDPIYSQGEFLGSVNPSRDRTTKRLIIGLILFAIAVVVLKKLKKKS